MLPNNISCATHVFSLLRQGHNREAIMFFRQLQRTGLCPITEQLLTAFVTTCKRISAATETKQAHCLIFKHGFDPNVKLMTSLVNAYFGTNLVREARHVFDEMPDGDVTATNCMISGLFRYSLTSDAIRLFDRMSVRDVVSWNALISGLAQNKEGRMALDYFEKMRLEGAQVDVVTMVSVLSVCADIAALSNGKQAHGLVTKYGFESNLPVGNATVDMYAKCGRMDCAYRCFKNITLKNVISWTSLIVGYGKHGMGIKALKAFDQMEMEGILPNKITFLGTLYACSHAGLVQEGQRIFNTMVRKYSVTPMMEHYTCMVDLLARSGKLEEAYDFVEKMPMKPESRLLTMLLSSCCSHKNVELARRIAPKLLELQPGDAGAYMLLSNFYGLADDLEGVANARKLMSKRGIRKEKACTWIEIDRKVHCFESGDRSHPLNEDIYNYLRNLVDRMRKLGYMPNTSIVMQNVDERIKEEMVLAHSEKLAIAFGLISTPPGTPITIVKNLRVCVDCHVATALISKFERREIIARDSSRFHHFRDGICSCGNHW